MTQSKPDQMSEACALVERLTGHTPGPWGVIYYDAGDQDHYDHNGPCPLIAAPEDQDCAIVHWDGFKQKFWSSANGDQKQIEANADLIAAAPELHSALAAALDEIERLRVLIQWSHDTLHEINPNNYDHDDVCRINDASVEVILGLAPTIGEAHGESQEWWDARETLKGQTDV